MTNPRTGAPRWMVVSLQLLLTLGCFAYLGSRVDWPKLRGALATAPLWGVPVAVATLSTVMLIGAVRWSWLLRAYGAVARPSIMRLFQLQLLGLMYNMLPGAVGGDVVRGVVTRDAFAQRSATAGIAVVLVERLLGLLGLILLVLGLLAVHPMSVAIDGKLAGLGVLAVLMTVVAIALGREFAHRLPAPLDRLAGALPELAHPGAFAVAVVASVVNQALVGVVGHVLIAPSAPQVSLLDSLVLSPIGFAAIFFPLTVAGAGTRDMALAYLYGTLGVPSEVALAGALQITLTYVVVAGFGALVAALRPVTAPSPAVDPGA